MIHYATCRRCGKKIHTGDNPLSNAWFDENGMFCYVASDRARSHIPMEEKEMYSENEIRRAWRNATRLIEEKIPNLGELAIDELMSQLENPTTWEEDDTLTVAELRQAWVNRYDTVDTFLRKVRENRRKGKNR